MCPKLRKALKQLLVLAMLLAITFYLAVAPYTLEGKYFHRSDACSYWEFKDGYVIEYAEDRTGRITEFYRTPLRKSTRPGYACQYKTYYLYGGIDIFVRPTLFGAHLHYVPRWHGPSNEESTQFFRRKVGSTFLNR